MSLYAIYMTMVSVSCIFGVTILSLTQYLVIHQMPVSEWLHGLPLTLGALFFFVFLIAIFSRAILNPILKIVRKSKTQELTEEEKLSFLPAFKKLSTFTIIFLIFAFFVANSAVVFIKAAKGSIYLGATPVEKFTTQLMFLVLAMLYGLIASVYCTTYFEMFSQKTIAKLGITVIPDGVKAISFTRRLRYTIILSVVFGMWNMCCVAYGMIRFPEKGFTGPQFMKNAFIMGLWSLFFTIPMLYVYITNVKKNFRSTAEKIQDLRESGDIRKRLEVASVDDFGNVNSELNKLMNFLSEIVNNISRNNNLVKDKAGTLLENTENSMVGIKQIVTEFDDVNHKSSNRDLLLRQAQENMVKLSEESQMVSQSMNSQASAIQQNAASVTEMVANINSITEMVKKARLLSADLAQASEQGGKEVKSTIDVITEIEQKSTEMTNIVTVIQSVSSETNLLAMNAAIEAAHAGEAGQGFAVVADEIRNLAESTSQSAKEIKNRIDEIVELIDTSSKSISTTSNAFNHITGGIQDQLQVVENISNAMEEQSIGASETLKVTNGISEELSGISELIKKQAEHALDVENKIKEVVSISRDVDDSLNDSVNVIKEFESNLNNIAKDSEANKTAVDKVQNEINKFSC